MEYLAILLLAMAVIFGVLATSNILLIIPMLVCLAPMLWLMYKAEEDFND